MSAPKAFAVIAPSPDERGDEGEYYAATTQPEVKLVVWAPTAEEVEIWPYPDGEPSVSVSMSPDQAERFAACILATVAEARQAAVEQRAMAIEAGWRR